jgi:hypothetical protein
MGLFDFLKKPAKEPAKEPAKQPVAPEDDDILAEGSDDGDWLDRADEEGRLFSADAEDLAEGGVAEWLESARPALEKRGVKLGKAADSIDDDTGAYTLVLGDRKIVLYTAEELAADQNEDANIWELTPARLFKTLNELLEKAGAKERLYALNGGNDLNAVLLTAEQHAAICKDPSVEMDQRPYLLAEPARKKKK